MKSLKHYLENAKDYLEGDGVKQFLLYYQKHEKIELAWRNMISSYDQKNEFSKLVEMYGLYILIDNVCSWKSKSIYSNAPNCEAELSLRIFNSADHNVAVLKCMNLPMC